MAYVNHARSHDSLDSHIDYAYEPSMYAHNKPLYSMESQSGPRTNRRKVNIFIVFVFIVEILVLVFVSVLECFLRLSDVFPVREITFSCTDPALSYGRGSATYNDFAYNADVSYDVIAPLCFCIPPFLIIVCEIAYWAYSGERQKTVVALCKYCHMPQVLRRMIRYVGAFLFGLLVTMIFVDVTKIFVGRLRPNFLEVCNPDLDLCDDGYNNSASVVCREKDVNELRDARLSFPSMHATMTSFAACFMAVYVHNIMQVPGVRVMRPFLSLGFIMCAVMCSLARYGLHYNHWTDVMVGFGVGIIMAIYLTVFVLNEFRERMGSEALYNKLRTFLVEQRGWHRHDYYKEERLDRNPYYTYQVGDTSFASNGISIPRPHVTTTGAAATESTTDGDFTLTAHHHREMALQHSPQSEPALGRVHRYRQQDTFQRDLNRALYQYRSNGSPYGHI